ncbi:DUF1878 domain-containing protein [Bacillus altitudinis]|uniref:DUF1878 family protein n=1 Tax=Bacillus aerius TaxID=293388 RepID=A0ABR6B320_9BACI|nr:MULTISPECIES: DUF1878 domain-containing protein [Bacillus]MBA8918521.1 hypothetical protein [Bacillus aerius]MDI6647699.1 DUF1878 domain-containing protein [Bacillus altitudinis]MDI6662322.1 DUF1878 domain-containing protein [Bacillus altitudinis]UNG00065.1 DUF1878 domain-containing protein [Bacillus altitudinis]
MNSLEERLQMIEFRQELLFRNDAFSRLMFEYEITKAQQDRIYDLMDLYRKRIGDGEEVDHRSFEQEVYEITPQNSNNYQFVEFFTKELFEADRWKEVYEALYGESS